MNKDHAYNQRLVFTAACVGMLLFGVSLISLGTILPGITANFALDEKMMGSLVTLLPIGLLTGSLIFGLVVDRYGYKYLMIICSLMILLGLEGIAYGKSIFLIRISVFCIGSGGGALNGATNALVNDISSKNRSANLSFLGVFFGIGALGMPVLIGILSSFFSEEKILSVIGWSVFIPVLFFLFIRFPVPKQILQLPIKQGLKLLTDSILILTGLILFLESGIEGIINNWTTTFLQKADALSNREALFSLSAFVFSLTVSRFILGFVLKRISSSYILLAGAGITATGIILLFLTTGYLYSLVALFLLGIGCAAVFPVVLSYTGELFSSISGTAFSIVMVIAAVGNILINYSMGLVAHRFGISHYTTLLFISLIIMLILILVALRRIRQHITV